MPYGRCCRSGWRPTAVINHHGGRRLEDAPVSQRRVGVRRLSRAIRIVQEEFLDLPRRQPNIEMVPCTPRYRAGRRGDKPICATARRSSRFEGAWIVTFSTSRQRFLRYVRIVSEEAARADYPLRGIHIPKTIDNDLVGTYHKPGFPSAARLCAGVQWAPTGQRRATPASIWPW